MRLVVEGLSPSQLPRLTATPSKEGPADCTRFRECFFGDVFFFRIFGRGAFPFFASDSVVVCLVWKNRSLKSKRLGILIMLLSYSIGSIFFGGVTLIQTLELQ